VKHPVAQTDRAINPVARAIWASMLSDIRHPPKEFMGHRSAIKVTNPCNPTHFFSQPKDSNKARRHLWTVAHQFSLSFDPGMAFQERGYFADSDDEPRWFVSSFKEPE